MKTAYELAMERLNKNSPGGAGRLSDEQRKDLAELDSTYAARIAEREIALQPEIDRALASGGPEKADELRRQLIEERRALQAELEGKKEQVRARKR